MKQLDKQQIAEIRAFVIKRRATYFEVIEELTDHLATAIEKQWEITPTLSFQEALYKSFQDFGVENFKKLTRQRARMQVKEYVQFFIHSFLQYFTFPRMVITTAIYLSILFTVNYITNLLPNAPWATLSTLFYSITGIAVFFGNLKKQSKAKVKGKKLKHWYRGSNVNRLLLDEAYTLSSVMGFLLILPTLGIIIFGSTLDPTNLLTQVSISALFTLFSVGLYIIQVPIRKAYLKERAELLKLAVS